MLLVGALAADQTLTHLVKHVGICLLHIAATRESMRQYQISLILPLTCAFFCRADRI